MAGGTDTLLGSVSPAVAATVAPGPVKRHKRPTTDLHDTIHSTGSQHTESPLAPSTTPVAQANHSFANSEIGLYRHNTTKIVG